MTVEEIKPLIRKKGIGIYGGTTNYDIYICAGDTFYGTGDYEDDPQIANDKKGLCFTVYFSDILDSDRINASAGQYESYDKAMEAAENTAGFIRWIE